MSKATYVPTYYFVLNGFMNGQKCDGKALTAGHGHQQPDGWYFLFDNGMPDGEGPFNTRELAESAAREETIARFFDEHQHDFSSVLDTVIRWAQTAGFKRDEVEKHLESAFSIALHYAIEDIYNK